MNRDPGDLPAPLRRQAASKWGDDGAGDVSPTSAIRNAWLRRKGRRIPYGLGAASLRRAEDIRVLERAYEEGYRYFDTSLYYGDSELVMGTLLAHVPRQSVFVATKTDALTAVADRPPQTVRAFVRDCLHKSLDRLSVESVDLYQLHEIDSLAPNARRAASEELALCSAERYCRYIGATGRNLHVLGGAAQSGRYQTVLTYSDYTPLRQDAARMLSTGNARGVAMINASPLAFGLLTDADPSLASLTGHAEHDKVRASDLHDLCARFGVSTIALALQFPIRNDDVVITLNGPASVEQLMSSLDALETPVDCQVWTAWNEWNGLAGTRGRAPGDESIPS